MNEHAEIMTIMQGNLEALDDAVEIMPSALAHSTFTVISPAGRETRLVGYLSLQMLTVMARKILARKFDHDSDETDAYQGALFSNALQDRYPLPRKAGEDPVYKKRSELTQSERAWNVSQLRKSAQARLEHADALEAEGSQGMFAQG